MSSPPSHDEQAQLRGIGAGLLAGIAVGLAAGLVFAVGFYRWPAEMGEGFSYLWNVGVSLATAIGVGAAIGLVVGTSLAWHGGIVGSTLDRGDAAPIFGVLTGIVLGGTFGPLLGGVLGLLLGQLLNGAVFGLVLGPIVGVIGWETAYWAADYSRGTHHAH